MLSKQKQKGMGRGLLTQPWNEERPRDPEKKSGAKWDTEDESSCGHQQEQQQAKCSGGKQ